MLVQCFNNNFHFHQVKMNQEGIIQVGTDGEDLPFMEWQDPEPLDIQYFSFCTWSGVAGKWLYDCALTDNDIGMSGWGRMSFNYKWHCTVAVDVIYTIGFLKF